MARGDAFDGIVNVPSASRVVIQPAIGVEIMLFHLAEAGAALNVNVRDSSGNTFVAALGIFGGNTAKTYYIGDMGLGTTLKLIINNSNYIAIYNGDTVSHSGAYFGIQTK